MQPNDNDHSKGNYHTKNSNKHLFHMVHFLTFPSRRRLSPLNLAQLLPLHPDPLGHEIHQLSRPAALLQRSPAWAAWGRVRLGRGPSTMQEHPSCRSKRMRLGAITSPSRSSG